MTSLRDAVIIEKKRTQREFEPNRILEISKAVMRAVDGAVEVVGRPRFVWIEEYEQHGGVSWAFSPYTDPRDGLHVIVGPDPNNPYRRVVLSPDWDIEPVTDDYEGDAFGGDHGETHEWPDFDPGADTVTVYPRSFSMLRTYAGDDLTINVSPIRYEVDGTVVIFGGHSALDISAHQPAAGLALYVLVYLNTETNAIVTLAGDTVVDADPIAPSIPSIPVSSIPSACVRLDGAQTTIAETDILDIRMVMGRITGQNAVVREALAILEAEIDYILSNLVVRQIPEWINRSLSIVEAEFDYAMSDHVVELH